MTSDQLCVILLNYSNWRDTTECLESLGRTAHKNLSVVVVDCGSPDDSVERLAQWVESGDDARADTAAWRRLPAATAHRPSAVCRVDLDDPWPTSQRLPRFADRLSIVRSPRRLGFAAGCNAGLRYALRDPRVAFFWLLNNDTITAPDAATRLVEQAVAIGKPLGALGCLIADYREPETIQILGGGRIRRFSAEPVFVAHGAPLEAAARLVPEDLEYISGASLFTTRSTIRQVGLLDETMHLYWEDTDWSERMRRAGRTLTVCPSAVVWHKGHASTGGINRYTKYHSFRSAVVFMRRHRRFWLAPLLVRLAKALARETIRVRPRDGAAVVRGFWAGLHTPRADPLHGPVAETTDG